MSDRDRTGMTRKVWEIHFWPKCDCTTLFRATIHAQTFALPDGKGNLKTLGELYVKPRGFMPNGRFHASVLSLSGDQAETFALAIDQLRLLRNSLSHLTTSKKSIKQHFTSTLNTQKMRSKLLEWQQTRLMTLKVYQSLTFLQKRSPGWSAKTNFWNFNWKFRAFFIWLGRLLWYDCLEQSEICKS